MSAATVPEMGQVLEFTLGEEHYCVGIDAIDEIVKPDEITPLPDTPDHVAGVMDLRGETTTIVKPKRVFETPDDDDGGKQVVIFEASGDQQVGWLVDRVHRVTDLVDPDLDPVEDNEFIKGVVSDEDADRFVLWVDPVPVNDSVSG